MLDYFIRTVPTLWFNMKVERKSVNRFPKKEHNGGDNKVISKS